MAARVQAHLPRRRGPGLSLSDAQHVIARESGFKSWPKLKKHIEAVTGAVPKRRRILSTDLAYNEERADALLDLLQDGLPGALELVRELHPHYVGASDSDLRAAKLSKADARLIYARDHACESWDAFVCHLEAVRQGASIEPFLSAFQAIQAGDIGALAHTLRDDASLANAGGTNGNTLLNLAVSVKRPRAVRLLLDTGADPNRANNRGCMPLHQAGYSNQPEVAQMLLDAGAAVDASARGDGGTPLVMALFWGHRQAADLLASHGLVPDNLRVAAGAGYAERVATFFAADGSLLETAGAHRGFYRPHSGFPMWKPSDNPQEVLDEALVYACKSGRLEVLPLLVDRGARIDADPYRGTPMLWAAWADRSDVLSWLLDHGADVNQRATFGGPTHGEGVTALHLAAQLGHLEVARLLAKRGADLTIRDALYNGTPLGWAELFSHLEVAELLRAAGARP
jgi:ankyrin repeat protein